MTTRAGGWWDNKVSIDKVRHEDLAPIADAFSGPNRSEKADVLQAFMIFVIPARKERMGARRQVRAGYVRFCASAWHCARATLTAATLDEFARQCGLKKTTIARQVEVLRRLLAGEQPGQMHLRMSRPTTTAAGSRVLPGRIAAKVPRSLAGRS